MPERVRGLLREIAGDAVPDSVDLWPTIRSRIQAGETRHHSRPRSSRRLLLTVVAIATLAVVLVTATPVGAAVSRQLLPYGVLQRFGLVLVSPTPVTQNAPTGPASARPTAAAGISGGPSTPSLTLQQAQAQARFPIRTPSWLPPNVVFRGALVASDGTVVVSYRRVDDPSKGMFIQMQPGPTVGGYAVPSSAAKAIRVDGAPAVYAHGSWDQSGNWHAEADAELVSWESGGMAYVLSASSLGLSRDDMIRIASSLR
jgi:hypothetical protein